MKTSLHSSARSRGSVLVVTLAVCAIIGISLASYLTLVSSQFRSSVRSQYWNSSIPFVEAGIEEALAHLNYNCVQNGLNPRPVNFHADGWIGVTNGVRIRRDLPGGYYEVTILTNTPAPEIISVGYAATYGLTVAGLAGVSPFIASSGVNAPRQFISRTVRCGTAVQRLFPGALSTRGTINLSGNNVRIDSYDSDVGPYDRRNPGDQGKVATNSRIVDDLNSWNAEIFGPVATGPGGSIAMGPNGSIGDRAWHDSGKKGIQPGKFTDDSNMEFPDVELPYAIALPPEPGPLVHNGVTYDWVLRGGNYMISAPMQLTGKILVTAPSVLIVNTDIKLAGQDRLLIETNASLRLYANCQSVSISGSGIINTGGIPENFMLLATSRCTSIQITGNAEFNGVIYAPQAHALFGGGGADTFDISGSVTVNTARLAGKFNIHYDEALGRRGLSRGYVINSWREL
jgi:hypothetical protein